jgi:hypothetical protein
MRWTRKKRQLLRIIPPEQKNSSVPASPVRLFLGERLFAAFRSGAFEKPFLTRAGMILQIIS